VLSSCVVLSVALHGLLLSWGNRAEVGAGRGAHVAIVMARLIQHPGNRSANPAALAEPVMPAWSAEANPVRSAPVNVPRESEGIGGQAERWPSAQRPPDTLPGAGSALATGEGDDELVYLPRSRLTKGPQPKSPVTLSFPAAWNVLGRHQGQFALYIDERGVVQRVEPLNRADFPAPLEKVVRETFMGVLFQPGELNGQAVGTRTVIEVVFDAESTQAGK
jgi:hypothetical protein